MSKQKEREKVRIRKKQQRSRQLVTGGIVLILIAGLLFLFLRRGSDNSSAGAISHLTTRDFHSLAFSPMEAETIFFGHHNGLLVSYNGGKDWQSTSLENTDAMALALPLSNSDIMYAAGHDVFFKSTDGGKTWNAVTTNLPSLDIHGFTVDPENAERAYAHVVGFGIFGSEDGGSTWSQLSDSAPPSTFNLAMGESSDSLYAAAGGAGLWHSLDGGRSWSLVENIPDTGADAVVYVRANKRLLVTTTGNSAGLYVSDDNGQSWKATGMKGIFVAIAGSPLDPNHIVVVSDQGDVFASRDSGLTLSDK
jgi:photosystem II stability/assembly factor-like uncharacterized protein